MQERWLTLDEIAEHLGFSTDAVCTWVMPQGMTGHEVGRFWQLQREGVDSQVRASDAA